MKKNIVITSIYAATDAVNKFSKLDDYDLIVVGDKKTPADWNCQNAHFISVEEQSNSDYLLNKALPFNHYCRKMMGYLYAFTQEAEIIIDTDDDNIPRSIWAFPELEGRYPCLADNLGFINIYELYSEQKIWPRGYPLRLLQKNNTVQKENITAKDVKTGIWQGLANGDPDVDAIYRLTIGEYCDFQENGNYVLGKGTITPFNSQNTAFAKDLFPLLYLPAFVTFRFTDILRGLVAQPIMWLYDYHLGFTGPTVVQERNEHDYMKDFESEVPMYLHAENIVHHVSRVISANSSIEDNLTSAYEELVKATIVPETELLTLEAWLSDYANIIKQQSFANL